jgi:flotillin
MKSIPPMNEVFDMAGMKLPEYLGTEKGSNTENN